MLSVHFDFICSVYQTEVHYSYLAAPHRGVSLVDLVLGGARQRNVELGICAPGPGSRSVHTCSTGQSHTVSTSSGDAMPLLLFYLCENLHTDRYSKCAQIRHLMVSIERPLIGTGPWADRKSITQIGARIHMPNAFDLRTWFTTLYLSSTIFHIPTRQGLLF